MVIAFAAIGAAIIEQQLNMAAAEAKGATNSDAIAAFLAQVTVYLSLIGFVIQVGADQPHSSRARASASRLLILPFSLGTTAVIMLFNRALWAPGLARVLDTSLRYTVDKTSREVLFLPLPAELKYRAKPFIDVTMDRFAKGMGALLILVLIKDWGFGLDWQQLSYASLTMVGLWVAHRDCRAPRVPALVPPQHRGTGRRAVNLAAQRSRSLVGRNAGQRAGASRPETRALRDRPARRDGQATTGHAAAARARLAGRSARGRCGVAEAAGTAAGRSLAPRRRARAQGSGQQRAHRRRVGAWPRFAAPPPPT